MHYTNLSSLFLNAMPVGGWIAIAAVCAVIGGLLTVLIYKSVTDKKIGNAEQQKTKIINAAEAEAEAARRAEKAARKNRS